MNYLEGKDEMLAVFAAVWGTKKAIYPNVPDTIPTGNVLWARVTVLTANGSQSSLAGDTGDTLFDNTGTLWIQVFAPVGDGDVAGLTAAQSVVDAYRKARGHVWYRNIRMNEMGADGAFTRFDVKADFQYTDVSTR